MSVRPQIKALAFGLIALLLLALAIPVMACGSKERRGGGPKGNNGVGNGTDPQPPGNPPPNDGPGTGPGHPGRAGGKHDEDKKGPAVRGGEREGKRPALDGDKTPSHARGGEKEGRSAEHDCDKERCFERADRATLEEIRRRCAMLLQRRDAGVQIWAELEALLKQALAAGKVCPRLLKTIRQELGDACRDRRCEGEPKGRPGQTSPRPDGGDRGRPTCGRPPAGNPQPGGGRPHGNNGVGNGVDPQPPGNPPSNDGPGTGPGRPGNRGGVKTGR
jgi:hypothetical protein